MKRFYYHRLRNARIKSTLLGMVSCIIIFLLIHVATADTNNMLVIISFTVTTLVVALFLAFIPIGDVLEFSHPSGFSSFYQVGPLRFGIKFYSGSPRISIEKGSDRYYILRLSGEDGSLVLERWPTLDRINGFRVEIENLLDG